MTKRKGKAVPPLQNQDVTGMTDAKQEAAIRDSGRAPKRSDAAREFIDEQREQARETDPSGSAQQPQGDGESQEHAGIQPRTSGATELEQHWDPDRQRR